MDIKKEEREKRFRKPHLGIFIVLFIAVIIFFILLYIFISYEKKPEGVDCYSDADCIKQRTTCCSCSMGGTEVCMSEKNATYWREKLVEECNSHIICIALYNCKETSCTCREGKCGE